MEADAQGIVVMFRDDLVDILIKEIERADRAEQKLDEWRRYDQSIRDALAIEMGTTSALRTELAQTQTALAEMTTDRNGWGDNSQRLEQALAAAKLEGARLRERLEATLHSIAWGHQHWDRMGTHGANCLLCIQQATVRDGIRELLATSPSLAADLGAMRELIQATRNYCWGQATAGNHARLANAFDALPAWLKGRGE